MVIYGDIEMPSSARTSQAIRFIKNTESDSQETVKRDFIPLSSVEDFFIFLFLTL